jgi:hypothetical protein
MGCVKAFLAWQRPGSRAPARPSSLRERSLRDALDDRLGQTLLGLLFTEPVLLGETHSRGWLRSYKSNIRTLREWGVNQANQAVK